MAKRRFQLDPRIKRELVGQRRLILLGLICTGLSAALYGSSMGLIRRLLKDLEKIGQTRALEDFDAMKISTLMIIGVFVLRYFFTRGQTYYLAEAVARLTNGLRERLLNKLLKLPVTYFNEKRAGSIQSVLTNDVNVFQSAVQILRDSIEAPLKAIVALILIIIIQWQMAMITFLMIPIMGIIVQRNAKKMRIAQKQVQIDLSEVGAVTQEVLQGVRVVKAFGAEEQVNRDYGRLLHTSLKSQLRAALLVARLRPLVELLGAVGLCGAILIGGWLALSGDMTVSDMAALAFALDAINQGFRGISNLSSTYSSVQGAADRIYSEILDVPLPPEHTGRQTLESINGLIEFRDVSFVYPDGTWALRNVSFAIQPGTSMALVGPSGAGKSTIADLLQRFYEPTSGAIFLDGTDIKNLDVNWLRSQIGVVPQHTFLFAGGIDENLRLGTPDATDEQLTKALQMAHAEDFSKEFRDRNVPVLGERGVRLSGGQMQRIAIARALVRDPAILLLDEATSALDAESEKAVTAALQEVMETRTTMFIAHRLTTAARADSILFLKRGEVIEQGSHTELMVKNGQYSLLFKAFSDGLLEDNLG
ncbi:MAG: ABC transporter ATP-binding protein [Fimbriimonas sp.]|nr:ABC transporter ATP-binding protein [Fimbriimonas sp.]